MPSVESNWTVQEETLAVSATDPNRGEKAQSSSLAPKARTKNDGRHISKGSGIMQGKKYFNGTCKGWIRHVIIGIFPHVKIRKSVSDATWCDQCLFRHT